MRRVLTIMAVIIQKYLLVTNLSYLRNRFGNNIHSHCLNVYIKQVGTPIFLNDEHILLDLLQTLILNCSNLYISYMNLIMMTYEHDQFDRNSSICLT